MLGLLIPLLKSELHNRNYSTQLIESVSIGDGRRDLMKEESGMTKVLILEKELK